MDTPKRRVIYLGQEREMPAALAERLVVSGNAQYAEVVAARTPKEPETASVRPPEKAVRAAAKHKVTVQRPKKGSKKGS
jgi:hypothetical protein